MAKTKSRSEEIVRKEKIICLSIFLFGILCWILYIWRTNITNPFDIAKSGFVLGVIFVVVFYAFGSDLISSLRGIFGYNNK